MAKLEASRSWAFILYPKEGSVFTVEETVSLIDHRVKFSLDYLRYIVGSPIHHPDSDPHKSGDLAYFEADIVDKDAEIDNNAEDEEIDEPAKEHIHILLNFPRRVRESSAQYVASSAFRDFAPAFTRVFRVSQEKSYFRYLFHLDNVEKEQFIYDSCTYFKFFNEKAIDAQFSRFCKKKRRYLSDAEAKEVDIIFIERLIEEGQCISLWDLVKYFSEVADTLDYYNSLYVEYRTIIRRNKSYFEALCNHFAHKNRYDAREAKKSEYP